MLLDLDCSLRAFAAFAQRAYTGAMRAARKIRYRLEWLWLKSATAQWLRPLRTSG